MKRMQHPEGGARVLAFDKREFRPDAAGVTAVPDEALPVAVQLGYVLLPPEAPGEAAVTAAELDVAPPVAVPRITFQDMQAPMKGFTLAHEGVTYQTNPDGRTIAVPHALAALFRSYGCTDLPREANV